MKLKILFLGLILIFSNSIAKTKYNANDTLEAESKFNVMVTAPRENVPLKEIPAAVSVVGEGTLEKMTRTYAIDEALSLVPGVRIDNQYNAGKVHMSIRGQGILSEHGLRGIKVLLDGIPLNDPTGFAPDLYDIDWETVDKIELLRGPAAALYGGSASAGILNIITKAGSDKPVSGEVFTSAGSDGFWKAFGQVTGSKDKVDYRISFSRAMSDGYREHSGFWSNNISEKLTWRPANNVKITQVMSWTDYFQYNPEGLSLGQLNQDPKMPNPDAIPMNEYQKTGRFSGGLVGNIGLTDNQDIMFNLFLRNSSYDEPGSKYIWHNRYLTPGASAQYNIHFGSGSLKNTISAGADFEWQFINGWTVKNMGLAKDDIFMTSNQSVEQSSTGLFVMDRLDISDDLSIVGNLRYDNIQNKLTDNYRLPVDLSGEANFDKVTGRLGITYNLKKDLSIYANWGQGFLPPATEELSSNPVSPGGFNQSLSPATSNSEEVGVRTSPVNSVYLDAALFYMTTDKDFDRYRILPDRPLETFYRNLGSSRRFGLETFVEYTPVKQFKASAAYTFSNFRYTAPDSIKDNMLPNSPDHQLTVELEFKPVDNLAIIISDDYQSKWSIYSNNKTIFQDGFNLINARISYGLKIFGVNLELSLASRNLLDKKWVAFTEPDPDGNCYQPGPGREFFGGLRIKF